MAYLAGYCPDNVLRWRTTQYIVGVGTDFRRGAPAYDSALIGVWPFAAGSVTGELQV
jgi:hypothetical protein